MADQYEKVRSLSFQSIASALGIDLSRFKTRKNGELYGPCPVCRPKHNTTAFSYATDGRFNCFSGGHHGKGSIDLIMQIRSCGFQDAVRFLEVITPLPAKEKPATVNSDASSGVLKPFDGGKYHKFAQPCACP